MLFLNWSTGHFLGSTEYHLILVNFKQSGPLPTPPEESNSSALAIILPLEDPRGEKKKKTTKPTQHTTELLGDLSLLIGASFDSLYRVSPAQTMPHSHLTTPHWNLRSQHPFGVRICSVQGKTTKQKTHKRKSHNLEINCLFSYQQQPIDTGFHQHLDSKL